MKKIVCNISETLSLNSINNDDKIIGIYDSCGVPDIHIVARIGTHRYSLISMKDYMRWEWYADFSLIRDLVRHYWNNFKFYRLDDWKEIKEFIK